MLQCVAVFCINIESPSLFVVVWCSVLQFDAVCCRVLQSVAVRCSVFSITTVDIESQSLPV